ncbi:MAG: hypothetical protein QXU40_02745 [Candidatus Pacearchaeota archaeon]
MNQLNSSLSQEYYSMVTNFKSMLFDFHYDFNNVDGYDKVVNAVTRSIWMEIKKDVSGYKMRMKRQIVRAYVCNLIAGLYYKKVIALEQNVNAYHGKKAKKRNGIKGVSFRTLRKIHNALKNAGYIDEIKGYWDHREKNSFTTRVFSTDKFANLLRKVETEEGNYLKGNIKQYERNGKRFIVFKILRVNNTNKSDVEIRGPKRKKRSDGKNSKSRLNTGEQGLVQNTKDFLAWYNKFAKEFIVGVIREGNIDQELKSKKAI